MHPRNIYPKYPLELGCEAFQPILATATYPGTGLPNAKGRAKYTLTALLQFSKAHWAILNDTDFPKADRGFSSTRNTLCCVLA